ncbi:hypothetical protein CRM22_000171, partial [Opisthorchis felineus]
MKRMRAILAIFEKLIVYKKIKHIQKPVEQTTFNDACCNPILLSARLKHDGSFSTRLNKLYQLTTALT